MWPVVFRIMRQYAPFITLPFAGVIGYIGYHIEDFVSDKYTPYNKAIEESRKERLITDDSLSRATEVEALTYSANVLGKNISPSLK